MQSGIRGFLILALGVALGLLFFLFVQIEVGSSFRPGATSPAMQFLLQVRAAENGGQIAPSFEELGIDPTQLAARMRAPGGPGGPGGSGGLGSTAPAALSKNFDPAKAPAHSVRDLSLVLAGAIFAAVLEIVVFTVARRRRTRAEPA